MQNKFALRNYKGEPTQFYLVDSKTIRYDPHDSKRSPAHHIFVIDASGSMAEDMIEMKVMIEKIFVLEEYHDIDTLFSLISYASEGDLIVHFSRVKVSDINQANSPEMNEIKALETRGSTCISQAIEHALNLVEAQEVTCISLHSDGYANDRTVTSEHTKIEELIHRVNEHENVFVNTFAYRSSADFKMLSKIANSLNGRCLQTSNIKEIYDALRYSTDQLPEVSVRRYLSKIEDYTFQVLVSAQAQRINGSTTDLKVRGIPADIEQLIYQYKEVSELEFQASSAPECGQGDHSVKPLAAFAKAQLTMGRLNSAKYALVSMRASQLLQRHARTLTNDQIVYFSNTLEKISYEGLSKTETRSTDYGFDTSACSVISILQVLSAYAAHIKVDLETLLKDYRRSSIHRIEGRRDENGKLSVPWLKTQATTQSNRVQLRSVVINRNDAEVDLNLVQEVELINRETDELITHVAGIDLRGKLNKIKSYKLVTGGVLNVPSLRLKLESKQVFRQLKELGVCTGEYQPTQLYTINLSQRPLVDYGFELSDLNNTFECLCRYRVLTSMLNALLTNRSVDYTDHQVQALKEHYITSRLNLSMPTTTTYQNLEQAITEGIVDARNVYKIDIGSTEILNLGKFKSANAYLARRFKVMINRTEVEKPSLDLWWSDGFHTAVKSLSSRTKLDETDRVMMPLFEDFLELGSAGTIVGILNEAGADEALLNRFKALKCRELSADDTEVLLHNLKSLIEQSTKQLYERVVCPLVFYIGTTGILPDMIESEILNAESLATRFPTLKLSKTDHTKTFYQLGSSLISVYAHSKYFSVP